MPAPLHLFGLAHLLILAAVPLFAALLAAVQRRLPSGSGLLRNLVALLLFSSSMMYYGYFAIHGQLTFPDRIPLQLCDLSLCLVIVAMFTLNAAVFDLAYYWGLAGASMSLLTPNLSPDAPVYLSVQFFLDHGLIVAGVLYLVWSGLARPRPGSVLRAIAALNIVALFVGAFNGIFKTDYMFLCAKPPTASLLDVLGPWPWYLLACEAVGAALFLLLYLPFRRAGGAGAEPPRN